MQEIKSFLDKVLQGDEKAFYDFRLARIPASWQFMDTLKYLYEKASMMPAKLDNCYPEMFIELGYFLKRTHPLFICDVEVASIIDYIKRAAKINDGAITALFILKRKVTSMLNAAEWEELTKRVKSIEEAANPNKHQLYMLGFLYYKKILPHHLGTDSTNKTLEHLHKAAVLGHATALNLLGVLYKEMGAGNDFSQEVLQAFRCYQNAAALGVPDAMVNLGSMFDKGIIGKHLMPEERDKEAYEWYQKAAGLGVRRAMYSLGWMLHEDRAGKDMFEKDRLILARKYFQDVLRNTPYRKRLVISDAILKVTQALDQLERHPNSLPPVIFVASQTQRLLKPPVSLQPPIPFEIVDNRLLALQQEIQQLEQTVRNQAEQLQEKEIQLKAKEELLKAKEQIIQAHAINFKMLRQPQVSPNTQTFFRPADTSVSDASETSRKHAFDVAQNVEHDEVTAQEIVPRAKKAKPSARKPK